MATISEIEGVGKVYTQKLQEAGLGTTEALLTAGATPEGRKALAQKTGIADGLILHWVNRADLFRIKGVGEQYSELLEVAGVDSVVELAQRDPAALHQKLVAANQAKNLVRVVPGKDQVADWVRQAKQLPRVVSH
jgi:predicted flap endonuclease-1-like 5' DNA nuclease